ncbi:hypothetical protein ACFZB9_14040 [Kitasatospora sp. NPDC008050]|uniref:hypothetical protein n=1 Tax=Kitasatospora sp. NPDC008050 TaxID=3364021 RepID=UPI0036EB78AA
MAVLDGLVSGGVGVLSVGVSIAMQVLASGSAQSMTAGGGRRLAGSGAMAGRGRRGGGGAVSGAMSAVLGRLEMPRVHVALFLTGGAGLAGTGAGHLLNAMATWANHLVASWLTKWVGGGVGFLVSGAALVVVIKDLRDGEAGPRTLALALALPCLLTAIPGTAGHVCAMAVTWVVTSVAHLIGSAFGVK